MARTEDQFNANTRSPRYGTSKAIGFRGGSTNRDGNLQMPTYDEVRGERPKAPPAGQETAAIQQFSARPVTPEMPSTAQQIGGAAASGVAGQVGKAVAKKAGSFVSDLFAPSQKALGAMSTTGEMLYGADSGVSGLMSTTDKLANAPNYAESALFGSGANAAGDAAASAGGEWVSGYDLAGDAAGFAGDAAASAGDWVSGYDLIDDAAASAAGDAAGSALGDALPYAGSIIRLAQGDVKGAAGAAIGTAIGGPIGGFIGGTIGGNCFITEAVMSAGGQDNGVELNTLRWFRDNILASTPQGQALIQEYEAMAPMVVEAIGMRPDALQLFQQIKAQFIDPSVEAVQSGNYKAALEIYAQMIAFVEPFAAEATASMVNEAGPADEMGSHAAMVAHDDQFAAEAAPGGPGNADWMSMAQHGGEEQAPPMPGNFGAAGMAPPGGNSYPMAQNVPIGQYTAQRRHF